MKASHDNVFYFSALRQVMNKRRTIIGSEQVEENRLGLVAVTGTPSTGGIGVKGQEKRMVHLLYRADLRRINPA
jgi:hypothetical protein